MRYVHTTIQARDIEKSIVFYQTLVGLKITHRFPVEEGEIVFLANALGETCIELVCIQADQKFEGKGISLGFETNDIEHEFISAQECGMNPSKMYNPNPHTKYFFVEDPDGVSVQLIQGT